MERKMKLIRFWSPELSISAKFSPKEFRNIQRVLSLKTVCFQGKLRQKKIEKSISIAEIEQNSNTNGWAPIGGGYY